MLAFHLDWMRVVLIVAMTALALSFWLAHRNPRNCFSLMDLVLDNGRVSRMGVAFMLTLCVTTWIIVDLELDGKLTEGYLTIYGAMWVGPLVARVVFNKQEAPSLSNGVTPLAKPGAK